MVDERRHGGGHLRRIGCERGYEPKKSLREAETLANALEAQDEDPRMELVQHLVEYSMFKEISEKMRIYESKKRDLFERLYPLNVAKEDQELSLDVYALVKAMDSVLDRLKERKTIVIPGERMKVKDRMHEIIEKLRAANEAVSFFEMCAAKNDRIYIIALFLAMLELLRLKIISVNQNELFTDINIYLTRDDFDAAILQNMGE